MDRWDDYGGYYGLENSYPETELYHYGVKGQKWGVRRYQNSDGSLTEAGRAHYGRGSSGGRRRIGKYVRDEEVDVGKYAKRGAARQAAVAGIASGAYGALRGYLIGRQKGLTRKGAAIAGAAGAGLYGLTGAGVGAINGAAGGAVNAAIRQKNPKSKSRKAAATAAGYLLGGIGGATAGYGRKRVGYYKSKLGGNESDRASDPKFRTKAERDAYDARTQRAKKIARNVAIGVGGAAALAGGAYLAKRAGIGKSRALASRMRYFNSDPAAAMRAKYSKGKGFSKAVNSATSAVRNAATNIRNKANAAKFNRKMGVGKKVGNSRQLSTNVRSMNWYDRLKYNTKSARASKVGVDKTYRYGDFRKRRRGGYRGSRYVNI